MSQPRKSRKIAKVIEKGFCIGCGVCTAVDPRFKIGETATGLLEIVDRPSDASSLDVASRVCPFADAPNETEIAAARFPAAPGYHPALGRYEAIYAGFSEEFRSSAGSGGITRWLITNLLDSGEIDFVLTVDRKLADERGDLFSVALHETSADYLAHTSTSAYFPISFDQALRDLNAREGRFAVTALPCFSRALRSYAMINSDFEKRMAYISGTICGALKGRRYAQYLAWQMGIPEGSLGRINFRGKSLSQTANEKCVEVWSVENISDRPNSVKRVQDLKGTDYGSGYFKPKACDYCDDVFAETADISLGDAWISPYTERPQGTNVIVVRNEALHSILVRAHDNGSLVLDELAADDARLTQNSGLRHRRQGLALRLWLGKAGLRWTPRKRVKPRMGSGGLLASQVTRILIRRCSQARWLKPDSRIFHSIMWRLSRLHGRLRPFATSEQSAKLGRLDITSNPPGSRA